MALRLTFAIFWLLLFVLYYPAAKAGFVTDFTGWLDQVKNHSFGEFVNRTHFQVRSTYQFTQFNTWVLYKLLGTNAWLWHLLFITLQALNASLLTWLACRLLRSTGANHLYGAAFMGGILFCISPYISEVVVWEPSFHFLQGLLLILLILLLAELFVHSGKASNALCAAVLYILSCFSLEVFYITPWLILALSLFHRYNTAAGKTVFRSLFRCFFIPLIGIFLVRIAGYRLWSGDWVSRIGSGAVGMVDLHSFGKPAKYLFHLIFLGRFFPDDIRHRIYDICDSLPGILIFYSAVLLVFVHIARGFRHMKGGARVASLLFVWMLAALLLLVPLWFQEDMMVVYDRYVYIAGAFFYVLFALLVPCIQVRHARTAIWALFTLVNLRFAILVNRYWGKSCRIVYSLLHHIPGERNKTILLLNLPQNMHGIPMIGAEKNSEYKLMHDLLIPGEALTNTVYDVLAYNMLTPTDGAHVNVINDSLIKVTLNQWGTWWWFETRGASSYWTSDYKLDLKDPGHWYELTLRKPASNYILLYSVGDQWKAVDMTRKGPDQD